MLGILMTADMNKISAGQALQRFAEAFVKMPEPEGTPRRQPPLEPMSLYPPDSSLLPSHEEWGTVLDKLNEYAAAMNEKAEMIDGELRRASPRWRLERMTVLDRALLRLGTLEMVSMPQYKPRQTFNGVIELAKIYGSDNSSRFVNGILDQIRKNLDIPFS